jgi:hypothetical protein
VWAKLLLYGRSGSTSLRTFQGSVKTFKIKFWCSE